MVESIRNADDLTGIYQYLLLQARVPFLHSELCFIEDFLDAHLMKGEGGYCLVTMNFAINALSQIDSFISLE